MDEMTSAEFRIARERMGFTAEALAERLGVVLRTVRRWEHGHTPIPGGVAADMAALTESFEAFVAQIAAEVEIGPDENGESWLITYASDETLHDEHPEVEYSAGYHRAVIGEVARVAEVPVRVRFFEAGKHE